MYDPNRVRSLQRPRAAISGSEAGAFVLNVARFSKPLGSTPKCSGSESPPPFPAVPHPRDGARHGLSLQPGSSRIALVVRCGAKRRTSTSTIVAFEVGPS